MSHAALQSVCFAFSPSPVTRASMAIIATAKKEEEEAATSWETAKRLLAEPDKLVQKLRSMGAHNVPVDAVMVREAAAARVVSLTLSGLSAGHISLTAPSPPPGVCVETAVVFLQPS